MIELIIFYIYINVVVPISANFEAKEDVRKWFFLKIKIPKLGSVIVRILVSAILSASLFINSWTWDWLTFSSLMICFLAEFWFFFEVYTNELSGYPLDRTGETDIVDKAIRWLDKKLPSWGVLDHILFFRLYLLLAMMSVSGYLLVDRVIDF